MTPSFPALIHFHGRGSGGPDYGHDMRTITPPRRYLFQVTLPGSGSLLVRGKNLPVGEHQAIFLPVPQDCQYRAAPRWEFAFLSVKGPWADEVGESIYKKYGPVLTLPKGSRALKVTVEAAEAAPFRDFISDFESSSFACRFLLALMEDLEGPPPGKRPLAVENALAYMRKNFEAPLSAGQIAGRIGVSREHFTREFKRHLGIGPAEHHSRVRLGEAASLLSQSSLSVREIAARTGFSDASAFARAFRRRFGASPEIWRKGPL